MNFTFGGETLDLLDHPYNTTRLNERAVEVPIARQFIGRHGIDTEIGNVLTHYGVYGHRVVDRYERGAGVENRDIFDLDEPLGTVVTISTIEHVRWDEPGTRDPYGAVRALEHLRNLATRLLVTVPLGCNPELDRFLLTRPGRCQWGTLVHDDANRWAVTEGFRWRPYGPWAGSVWVGEWAA